MLTKTDLKQIKTVVKGEIKAGIKPVNKRLGHLDKRMDGFDKRMDGFDKRMDGFDKRMDGFDKKLDHLEKGIKKNYDNINVVIGFFDRDYLDLRARIERIENFLKIPPLSS